MKTSVRWDGSAGELTFTHTPAADGGPHSFAATLDGKPVGKLLVASENDRNGLPSGAIANINVNPEHRKLGIGRAMVEYAQSQGVFPRHNPYMMTSDGAGFARATPGFGFISRGARMRPVAKQKSYTCKFCKQPATKGVLWAEGMAIIPACDKHLAKAKGAVTGPDGKPDPSEICGIRDLTRKSALDESGKIQFSLDNDGQYHRVRAIRDGQLVGNLFLNMRYDPVKQLDNVPGEIRDMWVRKPDRKHGIAKSMVQYALDNGLPVYHSNNLTDLGRQFANSMPLPSVWRPSSANAFDYPEGRRFKIAPAEVGPQGASSRYTFDTVPEQNDLPWRQAASSSEDDYSYRMQHRPPTAETGAPLHDLTGGGNIYPDDIYTRPKLYDYGEPGYRETWDVARRVRGKPDEVVDIYRSGPKPEINPGDWVSPSYENARAQGLHPTDEEQDMPVWHARVPAKYLHNQGDSLPEFGYNGPDVLMGERYTRGNPKVGSAMPDFVRTAVTFATDPSQPLPYDENYFYRLHPMKRRFDQDNAYSQTLLNTKPGRGRSENAEDGFSSFRNPHDLARYMSGMGWDSENYGMDVFNPHQWQVMRYRGTEVGIGADDEPLSIPEDRHTREQMDYGTFLQRLQNTPYPQVDRYWSSGRASPYQLTNWQRGTGEDEDRQYAWRWQNKYGEPPRGLDRGPDFPLDPHNPKVAVRWADTPDRTLTFETAGNTDPTRSWRTSDQNHLHAYINGSGEQVGRLSVYNGGHGGVRGEIAWIHVPQEYRGQGIARAMVEHAQSLGWEPTHSPFLSELGSGFASATPEFGDVKRMASRRIPAFVRTADNPIDWEAARDLYHQRANLNYFDLTDPLPYDPSDGDPEDWRYENFEGFDPGNDQIRIMNGDKYRQLKEKGTNLEDLKSMPAYVPWQTHYGQPHYLTNIAAGPWANTFQRARGIRRSGWDLMGVAPKRSLLDQHIKHDQYPGFGRGDPSWAQPSQENAMYAYGLMHGIHNAQQTPYDMYRYVAGKDVNKFLNRLNYGTTFRTPLISFLHDDNDYADETLDTLSQYGDGDREGSGVLLHVNPGARAVKGMPFEQVNGYEGISGGKFRVDDIDTESLGDTPIVHLTQTDTYDPDKLLEKRLKAQQKVADLDLFDPNEIDISDLDHLFDGPAMPWMVRQSHSRTAKMPVPYDWSSVPDQYNEDVSGFSPADRLAGPSYAMYESGNPDYPGYVQRWHGINNDLYASSLVHAPGGNLSKINEELHWLGSDGARRIRHAGWDLLQRGPHRSLLDPKATDMENVYNYTMPGLRKVYMANSANTAYALMRGINAASPFDRSVYRGANPNLQKREALREALTPGSRFVLPPTSYAHSPAIAKFFGGSLLFRVLPGVKGIHGDNYDWSPDMDATSQNAREFVTDGRFQVEDYQPGEGSGPDVVTLRQLETHDPDALIKDRASQRMMTGARIPEFVRSAGDIIKFPIPKENNKMDNEVDPNEIDVSEFDDLFDGPAFPWMVRTDGGAEDRDAEIINLDDRRKR